ncbi:MAG: glycosyltransferase family 2 protein [Crocosphaera sp.]|nr:glycosyltransferase family 2 protein [Crocosphaera sp.]
MKLLLEILLTFISCLILLPCFVLFVECLMSLLPGSKTSDTDLDNDVSFKILIPAHNEEKVISETLKSVLEQVKKGENVVVIADNCTDKTATIAQQYGVTVIQRENAQQRGKGYAIDYGINTLKDNPPEIVAILDADCLILPQTLDGMIRLAYTQQKPVQSVYLMETGDDPSFKDRISAFAILVKNFIRPYGLKKLHSPCLLNGSGMAFPWSIISEAQLANNKTVDDMQLSIDLAIAGYPPLYFSEGKVIGRLMQEDKAKSQRSRWEHGHLSLIFSQTPRLLLSALKQRRLDLLAFALELSVPPLSLLIIFWGLGMITMSMVGFLGISWIPTYILAIAGSLMVIGILSSWAKFGRKELPASMLFAIPFYLLWKIPVYFAFFIQGKSQAQWIKTERD